MIIDISRIIYTMGEYDLSIIDIFDGNSEEVLKPYNIASPVDNFPELVIVTFKDKIIDFVKEIDGIEQISEMEAGYSIPIYKFTYKGNQVAIYQTLVGGAGSANC